MTKQISGGSVAAKTLNACYSDAGLFGFGVTGEAKDVEKAVEVSVKALKSGPISDEDIKRGKEALKGAVDLCLESKREELDGHGMNQQACVTGEVLSTIIIIK